MPLIKGKSKAAFSENVKREMDAGKPQPQALAIAYSVKRKAKKKMAAGGSVQSGSKDMNYAQGGEVDEETQVIPDKGFGKIIRVGMAEGGEISAFSEKRPMPENEYNDSREIAKNKGKKALVDSDWTDNPTIRQAQKPSLIPLSRPKMAGSDVFSVRDRDDVEKDLHRMDSEAPASPKEQPRGRYDEEGAKRQGPAVSDMADEHSTHGKPYKKEVEDQYAQDEAESDMKQAYAEGGSVESGKNRRDFERGVNRTSSYHDEDGGHSVVHENMNHGRIENAKAGVRARIDELKYKMPKPKLQGLAKGGQVEASDYSHPENKYEHDFAGDTPSEDEGHIYANALNEEGSDRQGPPKSDNEEPHSKSSLQYRDSESYDHDMEMNPAHDKHSADDSESQPKDEADEEVYNSIAAAIMAKKDRESKQYSDSDIDEMIHMYEGGEITRKSGKINGMDSIYTHEDADQADLSRNAEEDANLEDQGSYDALRKENYSESEGLEQMSSPKDSNRLSDEEEMDSHDRHDMVDEIRKKMKSRKQFKRD